VSRFLLRRLGMTLIALLGVSTIVFALAKMIPG
jgi:ABC-type dipeptide/oligopeptide/nickel transport system permease component